jgi:hypothetical protein
VVAKRPQNGKNSINKFLKNNLNCKNEISFLRNNFKIKKLNGFIVKKFV